MASRVAVIIPVLNEAEGLAAIVQRVVASGAHCIVVDGGSGDDSLGVARAHGAMTVSARRGRASQMNAGVRSAGAYEILLFLHADVALPQSWRSLVEDAIDRGAMWGRFDVSLDSARTSLAMVGAMMNLRSRVTGIATGDQAIFIRRATFDAMGGFTEIPLMEDVDLCVRLRRARLPRAFLSERVRVSARRWEQHGVIKTIGLMWWLRFLWWLGVPARRLHGLYYGRRS